jgi:hypothetical protein
MTVTLASNTEGQFTLGFTEQKELPMFFASLMFNLGHLDIATFRYGYFNLRRDTVPNWLCSFS